eukprot:SAG31_NODE_19948_length_588_cov_0.578732_1_plen_187_part_01
MSPPNAALYLEESPQQGCATTLVSERDCHTESSPETSPSNQACNKVGKHSKKTSGVAPQTAFVSGLAAEPADEGGRRRIAIPSAALKHFLLDSLEPTQKQTRSSQGTRLSINPQELEEPAVASATVPGPFVRSPTTMAASLFKMPPQGLTVRQLLECGQHEGIINQLRLSEPKRMAEQEDPNWYFQT